MQHIMYYLITIIFSLLTAFAIVFTSIPTIVLIARSRNLYDKPGSRKSHINEIPVLGGVAIFAAILITIGVFNDFSEHREFQYLVVGAIILFFIGLKDDILIISPFKKLWGQVLASLIIILMGNFRLTSLHGFLGINCISYIPGVLLTLFVFVIIINGFNLIDGIDGLASGVGVVAALIFGTWFYLNCEFEYANISAAFIGSLVAFFWFNVFGKKNKIFMGDSGSLLVGLIMAVIAVQFNEMNIAQTSEWHIHASPAVSFGILIVPLFDTLRVFIIRIFRGQSPFKADTNHVHHRLLSMGLSHIKATLFILGVNVIFIFLVLFLNNWGVIRLMLLNLILATLFSLLPELIFKLREKNIKQN